MRKPIPPDPSKFDIFCQPFINVWTKIHTKILIKLIR
jgi:hypothetical protein